jgi:hypothetical protein
MQVIRRSEAEQVEIERRIRREEHAKWAEKEEGIRREIDVMMANEMSLVLQEHRNAVSEATLQLITSSADASSDAQKGALESLLGSLGNKEDALRIANSKAELTACMSFMSRALQPPPPSYASSRDHRSPSDARVDAKLAIPGLNQQRSASPRSDATPMRLFEIDSLITRMHVEQGLQDAAAAPADGGMQRSPPPQRGAQPALSSVYGSSQNPTPGVGNSHSASNGALQPLTPVQGSKPAASPASTTRVGGSQTAASPVGRWDFGDQEADEVSVGAKLDAASAHSKNDIRFLF